MHVLKKEKPGKIKKRKRKSILIRKAGKEERRFLRSNKFAPRLARRDKNS